MTTTRKTTRCLFCSLGCPLAVEEHARGLTRPVYVQGNGSFAGGRLCYRGHYVAALMSHRRRLLGSQRGRCDGGIGDGTAVYAETAEQIAQAIDQGSLGVLLSGNLATSDVFAVAARLTQLIGGECVSVFMPAGDAALLGGLEFERGDVASLDALKDADVVCAIGDVLGTHPVLGKALMDVLERNGKTGLINIDSARGRTMRFAQAPLLAQSGREAEACAALAQACQADVSGVLNKKTARKKLLNCCGLSVDQIDEAAAALSQAKSAVVVVTLPPGREHAGELIAQLASRLAQATEAKLLPLYQYGGSPGAFAVQRRLGLAELGGWLAAARAGRFKTMLLLDVDVAGHVPESLFGQIRGSVEQLIAASAMPSETTSQADIVLPLAFWFETDGHLLDQQGERLELHALRSPPGGALGAVALVDRIVGSVAGKAEPAEGAGLGDLDASWRGAAKASPRPVSLCQSAGEHSYRVTSRTETLDLYDGFLSRQLDWPLSMEPTPAVLMHPSDAEQLRVRDNDTVRLTHEAGSVELSARVSTSVWPGTLAVVATVPHTRNLFSWQTEDDRLTIEPLPVQVTALSPARQKT